MRGNEGMSEFFDIMKPWPTGFTMGLVTITGQLAIFRLNMHEHGFV